MSLTARLRRVTLEDGTQPFVRDVVRSLSEGSRQPSLDLLATYGNAPDREDRVRIANEADLDPSLRDAYVDGREHALRSTRQIRELLARDDIGPQELAQAWARADQSILFRPDALVMARELKLELGPHLRPESTFELEDRASGGEFSQRLEALRSVRNEFDKLTAETLVATEERQTRIAELEERLASVATDEQKAAKLHGEWKAHYRGIWDQRSYLSILNPSALDEAFEGRVRKAQSETWAWKAKWDAKAAEKRQLTETLGQLRIPPSLPPRADAVEAVRRDAVRLLAELEQAPGAQGYVLEELQATRVSLRALYDAHARGELCLEPNWRGYGNPELFAPNLELGSLPAPDLYETSPDPGNALVDALQQDNRGLFHAHLTGALAQLPPSERDIVNAYVRGELTLGEDEDIALEDWAQQRLPDTTVGRLDELAEQFKDFDKAPDAKVLEEAVDAAQEVVRIAVHSLATRDKVRTHFDTLLARIGLWNDEQRARKERGDTSLPEFGEWPWRRRALLEE
jgi:hypothetical protein